MEVDRFQINRTNTGDRHGIPEMIDTQKQFHDAIAEGCERETELRHLLADSSLLTSVDNYLGTPKITPLTFFLLMGSLILGLLLFDVFLPSLDTCFILGWGVAFSVTMFLYNSYATLAISLCLAGIFSLVVYSEQPLLCFIGILSLVLGLLAIWRFLKWFDIRKSQHGEATNHDKSLDRERIR
jgi:hypothetical protein